MSDRWAFAFRCAGCGWGRVYEQHRQFADGGGAPTRLLCQACGGDQWQAPRPGRERSILWWRRWTWREAPVLKWDDLPGFGRVKADKSYPPDPTIRADHGDGGAEQKGSEGEVSRHPQHDPRPGDVFAVQGSEAVEIVVLERSPTHATYLARDGEAFVRREIAMVHWHLLGNLAVIGKAQAGAGVH